MQEPEENKRHWGAKSYKSLWILPLIAFIAIFFLASSRNYIFEWQKEKDLQALGMIMKGGFLYALLWLVMPATIADYVGLVRREKTDHKWWKIISLVAIELACIIFGTYVFFFS